MVTYFPDILALALDQVRRGFGATQRFLVLGASVVVPVAALLRHRMMMLMLDLLLLLHRHDGTRLCGDGDAPASGINLGSCGSLYET